MTASPPPIDLVVFPVISFPALGRPALVMRQQLTYPSPPSIQTQLAGPNQEEYWNLVSAFLHKQASKDELAEKVPRLLGAQNLPLHHLFLRGIYSTTRKKQPTQQPPQGVPMARVASGGNGAGPAGPGPASQAQGMGGGSVQV